jgi:hypothetical protein
MSLIPPRRDELITKDGQFSRRLIEYLENMASSTNSNTAQSDLLSFINVGAAADSKQSKETFDLYLLILSQSAAHTSRLNKRINDLELLMLSPSAAISKLNKRISDLEISLNLS